MKVCLVILSIFILTQAFAAPYQLQKDYLNCIGFEKKITKDLAGGFQKIVETIPSKDKTDPKNLKKFEEIYHKHLNAKAFEPYYLESLAKNVSALQLKNELDKCKEGTHSDVTYEKTMKDVTARMKVEAGQHQPNPYLNMFQELASQLK